MELPQKTSHPLAREAIGLFPFYETIILKLLEIFFAMVCFDHVIKSGSPRSFQSLAIAGRGVGVNIPHLVNIPSEFVSF